MRIYNSIDEYVPHTDGVNVALGFFDGVHLGHREVIARAAGGELSCAVLTFRESPAKALGLPVPPMLSDNDRKAELLEQAGADEVIFADFAALRNLSPEDFVQDILIGKLRAKQVYCGFNYRFGRMGAGDIGLLKELCDKREVGVNTVEPVMCDGETVSSSNIRAYLSKGEIAGANRMLGYAFALTGEIADGNHIGTVMGFPTVNIPIRKGALVPRYGVYASRIAIGGREFCGATNIGVHPTVGANSEPLCETFLLDFRGGDLYGQKAVCELTEFIRPEKRFGSTEELAEQIRRDCERIVSER